MSNKTSYILLERKGVTYGITLSRHCPPKLQVMKIVKEKGHGNHVWTRWVPCAYVDMPQPFLFELHMLAENALAKKGL